MKWIQRCITLGLSLAFTSLWSTRKTTVAFAFTIPSSPNSLQMQWNKMIKKQEERGTPFSLSNKVYNNEKKRKCNLCRNNIKHFAKTEEEIFEDEDLADIEWGDEDIDASIPTYNDCLEQLQAFVFLCDDSSGKVEKNDYVARAQEVFDDMFEWYMTEDIEELKPDVDIYNLLIQMYFMVEDFDMAQGIISKMEQQQQQQQHEDEEQSDIPPPNLDTYLTILSYAPTSSASTPQSILTQIQSLYKKGKFTFEHLCPTTELCNSILRTFTKTQTPQQNGLWSSITIVEEFLEIMKNDNDTPPNVETYNIIMSYIAKCTATVKGGQRRNDAAEKGVEKVQNLFNELSSPDAKSYNALIKAYANTHTLDGAARAEEILVELASSYKKDEKNIRPNPASFVNAIYGWRNIPKQVYGSNEENAMCAERALGLLKLMEELALFEDEHVDQQQQEGKGDEEKETLWPDVRVYNAVLHVISRSTHSNKVQLSRDLLVQMKDSYFKQDDDENDKIISINKNKNNNVCPNTRSYNNVLNACAFLASGGKRMKDVLPQEKMDAFRVAVETFNNIRSDASLLSSSSSSSETEEGGGGDVKEDRIKADHVTYGLFLKCCGTLLPKGEKRDAVIENVFRKCCNDGLVSDFVLESFSRAGSDELCEHVLGGGGGSSSLSYLPMEWSANV